MSLLFGASISVFLPQRDASISITDNFMNASSLLSGPKIQECVFPFSRVLHVLAILYFSELYWWATEAVLMPVSLSLWCIATPCLFFQLKVFTLPPIILLQSWFFWLNRCWLHVHFTQSVCPSILSYIYWLHSLCSLAEEVLVIECIGMHGFSCWRIPPTVKQKSRFQTLYN